MQRILILAFAFVFFSSHITNAQLFYKVIDPASGITSYLFGSAHGSTSYIQLPQLLFDQLKNTKILYLEITKENSSGEIAQALSKPYSVYPEGTSIRDYLTEEEYNGLRSKFVQTGRISESDFDKKAVMFTPYVLRKDYLSFKLRGIGKSLDVVIENEARKLGIKDIRAFETMEQMALVHKEYASKLSPSYFVKHLDDFVKASNELETAYLKMDTTSIRKIIGKDSVIWARNKLWMKTLRNQLRTTPCFVAVGAAHLFGENGLIRLLRKEGYKIEAIQIAFGGLRFVDGPVTGAKTVEELKKESELEMRKFGKHFYFLKGGYGPLDTDVSGMLDHIAMDPILIGVKLNPELTEYSGAEVKSIKKSYKSYIISDSSEAMAIALGITVENVNDFRYHVVENDSTEIIPWSIPRLEQKHGAKRPYAFFGKYSAPGKQLMIEVINTKSYHLRDGVIFDWRENFRPVITLFEIEPSKDEDYFKIHDKKTNKGYAHKFDPLSNHPLDLRFPVDSVVSFYLEFKSHETIPYVVKMISDSAGRKDTALVSWWLLDKPLDIENRYFNKPGKYELLIQRIDAADEQQMLRIPFEVLPPPPPKEKKISLKQLIPYASATLLGVALLFIVYRQNYRRKLARAARQKEIVNLRLKSVRSQLNPHFMFNALSSIQNLMNKNDVQAANHYLGKFAGLTRHVLHTGEKDLVSLEDELKLLDDYLQMEQLRFHFSYAIKVDDQINKANTEIPSMLLQPFVENAVKHGVSALHEHGKIEINIEQKNKDLVLSVHDNGKGFGMEIDQEKKSSFGIKLSEQRIKLLNEIYKDKPATLVIESNDSGSLVTIKLTNWF